ncbi:branched-chain amino acid ABC transporter permease [Azospirillum doebereinerae]|uniref:Branched-chain amino acid ABC transporter permease n=1 Tax=Azospirillum doebereinerae TaxID=92933 RepID=A0A433J498_9PROT|nr:branched-chain amino acid ABC transporter permease [Azospirillum doebereinerae]MCG5238319.1 branched-chain amino acid ABC transporter permease [Azospirillum doebereinerae]RUQ66798.1 branched-chain amino acid ABC transporter permease [Azospirillum doebereinerae]
MLTQVLLIAAMSSALYMLLALGFTLIFGILRIVNFAHGEFVMIGAYAVFALTSGLGLGYAAALPLAALLAGGLGLLAERALFRRYAGDELGGMIMSLALAITLQGAAAVLFTIDQQSVERPVTGVLRIGDAVLPKDQLFVAGFALAAVAAFHLLVQRTRFGLALRAVAQDPETLRLQGVSPRRLYPAAFGIGCLLAGLAGALTAPLYTIHPYMGETAILKAFIVVVLGGLGSVPGAIAASVLLGVTEAAVSTWLGVTAATLTSFVAVMAILLVKPTGLGGRA